MRVIREQRTQDATVSSAASAAIALLQEAIREAEPVQTHRLAARDLAQQITALASNLPQDRDDVSAQTRGMLLTLRVWSARCATALADNPAQAVALCEAIMTDCEGALGDEHPDTLTARHCLASAYSLVGRSEDAITLHERNLALREYLLGEDHTDAMISRNNLATCYQDAGEVDQAIALHERNLTDRQRVLGDDHAETLSSRGNLALCYQKAGRLDR